MDYIPDLNMVKEIKNYRNTTRWETLQPREHQGSDRRSNRLYSMDRVQCGCFGQQSALPDLPMCGYFRVRHHRMSCVSKGEMRFRD